MTDTRPPKPRARGILLVYVVLATAVLLEPSPTIASSVVAWCNETALAAGAPALLTAPGRVEAVINAALFAPLAVLALLTFPRLRWTDVVALGFICSLAVEVVQGLLLPNRSAQAMDVVANTSGVVLGAIVVQVTLRNRTLRHRDAYS